MVLKISHNAAKTLLEKVSGEISGALDRYAPKSKERNDIESVILGTHLTYRYILVTGLLAKAIDKDINPICLQAGAPLKGAYDARSLCHKVIVPTEAALFGNRLGGSNEPYLNKPARFTHLSENNAVRKGADLEILKKVIGILSGIKSQDDAHIALKDAIFFIFKRPVRTKSKTSVVLDVDSTDQSLQILSKMMDFIKKSHEGETAIISAGSVLKALYSQNDNYDIRIHPANQAGSSSNEICDIDILLKGRYIFGLEIKDKPYNRHDVDHAIEKARTNGLMRLILVDGPRAKLLDGPLKEESNYNFYRFDIANFLTTMLGLCPPLTVAGMKTIMLQVATDIRAKDTSFEWLEKCFNG